MNATRRQEALLDELEQHQRQRREEERNFVKSLVEDQEVSCSLRRETDH